MRISSQGHKISFLAHRRGAVSIAQLLVDGILWGRKVSQFFPRTEKFRESTKYDYLSSKLKHAGKVEGRPRRYLEILKSRKEYNIYQQGKPFRDTKLPYMRNRQKKS